MPNGINGKIFSIFDKHRSGYINLQAVTKERRPVISINKLSTVKKYSIKQTPLYEKIPKERAKIN